MIFTAYFDESGTHAGAELTGMAGFLGDRRRWQKFEKRAGKLFKRFRVDVFHTIDVRRSDKDFAMKITGTTTASIGRRKRDGTLSTRFYFAPAVLR